MRERVVREGGRGFKKEMRRIGEGGRGTRPLGEVEVKIRMPIKMGFFFISLNTWQTDKIGGI